jgi:hypothetical protein
VVDGRKRSGLKECELRWVVDICRREREVKDEWVVVSSSTHTGMVVVCVYNYQTTKGLGTKERTSSGTYKILRSPGRVPAEDESLTLQFKNANLALITDNSSGQLASQPDHLWWRRAEDVTP